MAWAVSPDKRSFRVLYAVEKSSPVVSVRINTATLEELHKILVHLVNKAKPLGEWHDIIVHEHLDDGTVTEYGKIYLSVFDHKYEYSNGLALIEKEEPKILGSKLTAVIVSPRKQTRVLLSSNNAGLYRRKHVD